MDSSATSKQPGIESPEPDSPCVMSCVVDQQSGWCLGCYRTLTEISYWTRYTRHEKLAVLDQIAKRKATALVE